MQKATLVNFDNVRFCYGEVCAVNNVNFSIKEKGLTALIGPNGGGKSTLIKLLSGLLSPEDGNIKVYNNAAIGYVSQTAQFDVNFPITVKQIVLSGTLDKKINLFYRYTEEQHQKALDAIEKVGLKGYDNRAISQLSGGQLRRAMIARVVASDAEIIILDEPDSSLDADAVNELYTILNTLKKEKTIIVASHHIEKILDIVDSAIYVNKTTQEYLLPMKLKEKFKVGMLL